MKAFAIYGDPKVSKVTALIFASSSSEARECAEVSTGVHAVWLKAKRVPALDDFARKGTKRAYREYSPDYLEIAGLSSSGNHSIPANLDDCRRALIEERLRSDMAWSVLLDLSEKLGIDPEEARKDPGEPAKVIIKKSLKSKATLESLKKKAAEWNENRVSGQILLSEEDSDWLCDLLKINN